MRAMQEDVVEDSYYYDYLYYYDGFQYGDECDDADNDFEEHVDAKTTEGYLPFQGQIYYDFLDEARVDDDYLDAMDMIGFMQSRADLDQSNSYEQLAQLRDICRRMAEIMDHECEQGLDKSYYCAHF
eukprot:6817159-Heterocapsa_arctica.AAC.1